MSSEPPAAMDAPASSARLGRQLAAARESCGFSVAEVARQLRLSPAQVEAIEAGEFERLPGPVFVRGFIRNYARLVSLDPAPLLAETGASLSPLPPPEMLHSVNIPFPNRRELRWHKYAFVVLALTAVLVAYEFYGSGNEAEVMVTPRVAGPPPAEGAATEQTPAVDALPPPLAADTANPVLPAAHEQNQANAENVPELPTATAAHKPAEHMLKLKFERESWVEIRDGRGRRLMSQLNRAGSELAVSGLPPLSLVVGNAAGVRLTHNDQPVNLAPHITVDVARLTLE